MARISKLVITQSIEELRILKKSQKISKNIQRIDALIHLQNNTFPTRLALSEFMGVKRRTIERWLSLYRQDGIAGLLITGKRNRKSLLVPEQVDKALEQRINDSEQGFSSYVEAQQWIAIEFDLNLKYNTVREHLIRHYKTKIKSPRKSHVKKDSEAVAAFLKTT